MRGSVACFLLVVCVGYAYGITCFNRFCGTSGKRVPLAYTTNGDVSGHSVNSSSTPIEYFAFEGIPYAKPPVENLRFEPPEVASSWHHSTLSATKRRNGCIQLDGLKGVDVGSENCLILNVYVPPKGFPFFPVQSATHFSPGPVVYPPPSHLPVIVFIPSGGFLSGYADLRDVNPDYFMDRNDVIVVIIQYRLGIFGFASTGDSLLPGNNGLKDQVLALKWVQENIHNFGGDATLVTLYGEGSGSVFVSLHLLSPLSKGLFSRAIQESGSSLASGAIVPSNVAQDGLSQVARRLNINCTSSQCLVSKLKEVSASDLSGHAEGVQTINFMNGNIISSAFVFGPVLESNSSNAFLTLLPYEAFLNGSKVNNVPTIIGVNSQEAMAPDGIFASIRYSLNYFLRDTSKLVPLNMNIANKTIVDLVGTQTHHFYGGASKERIQFLSDSFMIRSVRKQAELQSKHYHGVYFYVFSYAGNLSEPREDSDGLDGVGHREQLAYMWYGRSKRILTCSDRLLILERIELYTNFAQFGDPTPNLNMLLNNSRWPAVNENKNSTITYLDIDSELTVKSSPWAKNMKFWDDLYEKYGKRPFVTY